MDVVIIAVAVATLAELLTDGHPVPALLAAICLGLPEPSGSRLRCAHGAG